MKNEHVEKLIFIYNADSGLRNAIVDSMHKVVSPGTYDCKLCEITFGVFTENDRWKSFRKKSRFDMDFLHKDEFRKKYASKFGYKFGYPIVLVESIRGLEIFVNTDELNNLNDAEELIELIDQRAQT